MQITKSKKTYYKNPKDIEGDTGIPTLAVIPNVSTGEIDDLSVLQTANHQITNAYSNLIDELKLESLGETFKVFLVASSYRFEGRTSIITHLAVMLSRNKRVIVVDCDFKNPKLHKLFGVQNTEGISDVLIYGTPISDVLKKTSIPNISFITCGMEVNYPGQLFDSVEMDRTLKELREISDVIFIDSSSILESYNSTRIARKVDGVIFVHKLGSVPKEKVKESIESLKVVEANILGIVYNGTSDIDIYSENEEKSEAMETETPKVKSPKNILANVISNYKKIRETNKTQKQKNKDTVGNAESNDNKVISTENKVEDKDKISNKRLNFKFPNVPSFNFSTFILMVLSVMMIALAITTIFFTYPQIKKGLSRFNKPKPDSTSGNINITPKDTISINKIDLTKLAFPHYPYNLHIGSYQTSKSAVSEVQKFRDAGFSAFTTLVDIPKIGLWYRVLVGNYQTEIEAQADIAKIKKVSPSADTPIIKKSPYSLLVGIYIDSTMVKSKVDTLIADGYKYNIHIIPTEFSLTEIYATIGTTPPLNQKDKKIKVYRIFIDAYSVKSEAEKRAKELAIEKIDCQLVER